jgi:hypothetical protein
MEAQSGMEAQSNEAPATADTRADNSPAAVQPAAESVAVATPDPVEETETAAIAPPVEEVQPQLEVAVLETTDPVTLDVTTEPAVEDEVLQSALDQAASSDALVTVSSSELGLTADYNQWLNAKLRESRDWLVNADRDSVSIQVLMRSKSAARELVYYLRNEWPLDLSETYLYEVNTDTRSIYRVFYSEFSSLSVGRNELERLPESVKKNSPYLHSVYRMQKALL